MEKQRQKMNLVLCFLFNSNFLVTVTLMVNTSFRRGSVMVIILDMHMSFQWDIVLPSMNINNE